MAPPFKRRVRYVNRPHYLDRFADEELLADDELTPLPPRKEADEDGTGLGPGLARQPFEWDFGVPFADKGAGQVNTADTYNGSTPTFTRATAAATKLASGLWKLDVASGVARSCYSGSTTAPGDYGGYLAEGAATQLALNPRDMTNASWTKGATITVAQTGTGIDGVTNSCTRVTGGAVAATNTVLQTLAAAASSRTYSVWLQRVTGTGPVSITQDGAAFTDVTALLGAANFVLVQLNASQLNASFGIKVDTNGDVVFVDCNQFEAGGFATTPIPAAGTRNADVLTYPFAGNASATQGACYAELSSEWTDRGGIAFFVGFGVGSADGILRSNGSDSGRMFVGDGTNSATKVGLTLMSTGVRKRASSWGSTGLSVTGDGVATATGTFDGATASTAIGIGVGGSNQEAYGTIKNLRISKRQFTDAELQRITHPNFSI